MGRMHECMNTLSCDFGRLQNYQYKTRGFAMQGPYKNLLRFLILGQ